MGHSGICRYCGGKIRVVPAEQIYGKAAAERLNLQTEYIHQCQNCNARVGCHKGTKRCGSSAWRRTTFLTVSGAGRV